MDGKPLGGKVRGQGVSGCSHLTGLLLTAAQGIGCYPGMVEDEEPDLMLRVGSLAKLT